MNHTTAYERPHIDTRRELTGSLGDDPDAIVFSRIVGDDDDG